MQLKFKFWHNWRIYYRNEEELKTLFGQIFEQEEYRISLGRPDPLIIDGGSHIGLTILYFKRCYPKAKILGFEPSPHNFRILKRNVQSNHLRDVKIIQAALWNTSGPVTLYSELGSQRGWTWTDTLQAGLWLNSYLGKKITVPTVKLSDYINRTVDLLKLDIEGAEEAVLREIEPKLKWVQNLILEYHGSSAHNQVPNRLWLILKLLKKNNFIVKIKPLGFPSWAFWRQANLWLHQLCGLKLFRMPNPYLFMIYAHKK